jgi:hypothetical protein
MLSLSAAALSFNSAPLATRTSVSAASVRMESLDELKAVAVKSNPVLGFWDPLSLAEYDQFSQGQEAAIGFLRHAEIKHGRVAMAAFVGFCVQSNGIFFPWEISKGVTFGSIAAAGGPADQWDALPSSAKLQIFGFIAFLELWGEASYVLAQDGEKHYMRGGKPGYFPTFKEIPHPVPLNLFDPFGLQKGLSAEQKASKLIVELNNGRLAMIGIMGFVAASKGLIVPGLDGLGLAPYAGEYMAPFSSTNADLPYVADMLKYSLTY